MKRVLKAIARQKEIVTHNSRFLWSLTVLVPEGAGDPSKVKLEPAVAVDKPGVAPLEEPSELQAPAEKDNFTMTVGMVVAITMPNNKWNFRRAVR